MGMETGMLVTEIHAEAHAVVAARVTVESGDLFLLWQTNRQQRGKYLRRQVVAGVERTLSIQILLGGGCHISQS